MTNTVGRLVVDVATNKSGGAVAYGDVVINDGANDHAFTTTTSAGFTAGVVGVCIEPNGIANNASGRIQYQGYCPQVNAAASVTRGYFLKTHTVAKQATSSSSRATGSFGVALKTSATPDAVLWGWPDVVAAGNVATDAIWDAAGDLAVGTGADTAARLAVGADSTVLTVSPSTHVPVWAAPTGGGTFSGARVYHSTTQVCSGGSGFTSAIFDSEEYDTDTYHDTGSNTSRLTAPATGYYLVHANITLTTAAGFIRLYKNNATEIIGSQGPGYNGQTVECSALLSLSANDYVEVQVYGNVTIGSASQARGQSLFEMTRIPGK